MNIFYLDRDPVVAAQMMVDKHVIKMILESAQMLCSAKRKLDGVEYYAKTKNGRKIKRYRLEIAMRLMLPKAPEPISDEL